MTAPTYRTIVIDPPWPQRGAGRPLGGGPGSYRDWSARIVGTASRKMPYALMELDRIAALPIADLAHADGAHLYLWTTNRFLPDAFRLVGEWGFRYSTTLTWAKAPMGGGMGGAYGISTEYILFARRGSIPALGRVGRTWFNWKRSYDQRGKPLHSAKPVEAYSMIETVSPGPRVDLFARRALPGWDVWGDQAPGGISIPGMEKKL